MAIAAAARPLCDVVFLCDRDRPHVAEHLDSIREHAAVVDITGLGVEQVCAVVADLAPAGVLTFSEYQLALTAEVAAATGLPFHDAAVVRTLVDKLAQREALAAAGVQSTRCVVVTTPEEAVTAVAEVGLPAVVKPRHGAGSQDTCRVADAAEAATVVARFLAGPAGRREFVVEELLVGDPAAAGEFWGDYVSVESVVQHGEIQTVCVTGKFRLAEPFRETGMLLPATLAPELAARVVDLERRALRALGVRYGVTHTELKLTADGPRVIEVNGRLGGYVGEILQRAGRFDLAGAAVRVALGLPVRVPPIRWRQLAYQYFLTPPTDRTTLVSLTGVEDVAALPGVRAVDIRATPGQRVDWRAGTQGHLGIVYGTAPDHDSLRTVVQEIESRLRPTYA
ncbi:MAG TPA: ATP-grasp domain-containing protein [Pseudonocardiaceae bacterium]